MTIVLNIKRLLWRRTWHEAPQDSTRINEKKFPEADSRMNVNGCVLTFTALFITWKES